MNNLIVEVYQKHIESITVATDEELYLTLYKIVGLNPWLVQADFQLLNVINDKYFKHEDCEIYICEENQLLDLLSNKSTTVYGIVEGEHYEGSSVNYLFRNYDDAKEKMLELIKRDTIFNEQWEEAEKDLWERGECFKEIIKMVLN